MDIRLESFVCSPGCLSVIRISRCEAFTEREKETKGSERKGLEVRHKLFGSFPFFLFFVCFFFDLHISITAQQCNVCSLQARRQHYSRQCF